MVEEEEACCTIDAVCRACRTRACRASSWTTQQVDG
jgi:hypothetical protein